MNFTEQAKKTGRIKMLKDAFIQYPCVTKYETINLENKLELKEETTIYNAKQYEKGDIVFVSQYQYQNGRKGKRHFFVIIDQNMQEPFEYYGMLISSKLEKLNYDSNDYLPKNQTNHLEKNSIVKMDILYRIPAQNIIFKVGIMEETRVEKYKQEYLKYE